MVNRPGNSIRESALVYVYLPEFSPEKVIVRLDTRIMAEIVPVLLDTI